MKHFPELMRLKEEFKDSTLLDYAKQHLLAERELLPLDREAYRIFCSNFPGQTVRRISTGSHMAFLQWEEPLALGENILANLPSLLEGTRSVISAPCSRITFKNSTRPGSIDLSGMGEGKVRLSRYTLRGRSKITINKAEKISELEMNNFLHDLLKFQKKAEMFPFVDQKKLSSFINLCRRMVSQGETFNEQCSWLSSQLWPFLFPDLTVPPLTIKPLEDLRVKRENILANKQMRALLEIYLQDSYGALSSTYFYYGSCRCGIEFPLAKREQDEQVFLEGNCLDQQCPSFGTTKYAVEVQEIISEVEKKNLHETLFISFYNIWALAGIDVFGGYNQIEYLKEFQEKLCSIFDASGEHTKSEMLRKRATNLLDLAICPAFTKEGRAKSGSQVLLEGGLSRRHIEQFASLSFSQAVDVSLATINLLFGGKDDHTATLQLLNNERRFLIT